MSQLALGTIGRSRSLINQSQESLDPGDHYDHSDREEEPHQQDADDEDDSGLVGKEVPNVIAFTICVIQCFALQILMLNPLLSGRWKAAASPWEKQ